MINIILFNYSIQLVHFCKSASDYVLEFQYNKYAKLLTKNSSFHKRILNILKGFQLWIRRTFVENVMPVSMPAMRLIWFTYTWLAVLNFELLASLPSRDASIQIRDI